jgi:hypothetical protein
MKFKPWFKAGTAKQNEKPNGDDLGLSLPIPGIWGQVAKHFVAMVNLDYFRVDRDSFASLRRG